tara:strand:+ start:99 stop:2630 length:2532 start_codon:yes stop_codon:yes gene_type:complete
MAKYELPQYQSMYKDTGSVQVNQLKRQEYMANMQADNALSTSIMNMEALEEDNEALYNLADKYNAGIDERAQRTDYENLGMTIHRDAMGFVKDYTPIKKSKDLYTAYEAMLNEKVSKGDITDSIKQRKIAQSKSKYKGIQYTPSGTVDQDSYFSGANVANYVDVNDEFAKAMKDVVARKTKIEGYELRDGNFQIVLDSYGKLEPGEDAGAPVWKIKKGDEIIGEVDSNLVADVTGAVLRREDVHSYLRQEADLSTYMFSEEEAEEKINNSLAILDSRIDDTISDEDLTDDEKADQIEGYEEYKEKIIENAEKNGAQSTLLSITHDDLNKQYLQDAQNKYVYSNRATKEDATVLDEDGIGSLTPNDSQVIIQGEVSGALTADVLGGKTLKDKRAFQNESQNVLDSKNTKFGEEFTSDMLNVNTDEDVETMALKYNLDPKDVKSESQLIKRNQDNVDLMELQIQDAVLNATGGKTKEVYDQEISDKYTNLSTSYAAGEDGLQVTGEMLLKALQSPTFVTEDDQGGKRTGPQLPANATVKDAMDWMRDNGAFSEYPSSDNLYGHKFQQELLRVLGEQNLDPNDIANSGQVPLGFPNAAVNNLDRKEIYASLAMNYLKFASNYDEEVNEFEKGIEKHLNTQQIKFDDTIATSFGDNTTATRKEIRDTIKEGIPGAFATYSDVSNEPQPWDKVMEETYGDKEFKILPEQSGLSNISMVDGTPLMVIAVKSEGKIKTFHIKASQFNMPSVSAYTNSTGYRVRSLYARGQWANVDEWSPKLFRHEVQIDPEDASKGTQEVDGVLFKYKSDPDYPIHVRQADGSYKPLSEKVGLEYIEKYVKENGTEDYIY